MTASFFVLGYANLSCNILLNALMEKNTDDN